ncbi:DUF1499 domain-containing protein [Spirulina sp. CS-785/01]|uniref:DUF1499 domain-containing protein n=1 Tax=Spirulina sp. CS-785/01 TaxID=3021716 RepID=UPI00232B62F5|nr:DUF1499 domain-containing protein [Spirulina sp. CS-785/01]MDB9312994.1 DUF1499 domain-containing protein [Spirulina sp. CS-785/01]
MSNPNPEQKTQGKKRLSASRIFLIAFIVVAIGWLISRLAFPGNYTILSGTTPQNLGVESGQLAPCPSSPNCVNSQSDDPTHSIAPLQVQGSGEETLDQLKQIIENQERTNIVAATDTYLYAEFISRWMGYVDDVEFWWNDDENQIEVRSASRLGESDLGVNRERIETLREQLTARTSS